MSFAAPLWLIAWAAACGLVIWLHTHRPEQRDLRVPSLILWKRAAQRIQGDAKWRKLLANLLLALQLLALTALGAALAQPSFALESSRPLEIVVLDTSASMGARQGPSGAVRLDAAKKRAEELVLGDHAPRIALITAGAKAQLALAPGSPAAFKQALGHAQSTAGPADWSDAADLVRTLIGRQENARVSVITDGDFTAEEIAPLEAAAGAIQVERVGTDLANVGIVAFSARQSGQSFADYQLLATVQNFGAAAASVPLRITQGARVLAERTMNLGPNAKGDVVLDYTYSGSAVVTAAITPPAGDALSADDAAYTVFRDPLPTHVLVVGSYDPHLLKALTIYPGVLVDQTLITPAGREFVPYQLVILNRVGPPADLPTPDAGGPAQTYLLIDPPSGSLAPLEPVAATPAAAAAAGSASVIWWNRNHPLLRFVDLSQTYVARQRPLPLPAGAESLAETEAGPLITSWSQANRSVVAMGFSLTSSNLTGQVAFPVLVHNLLALSNPGGFELARPAPAPGATTTLDWTGRAPVTLTGPGVELTLTPKGGRLLVPPLAQAGLYQLKSSDGEASLALNLASGGESDLRARYDGPSADAAPLSIDRRLRALGLTEPLIWIALAAFMAESLLFLNRRRLLGARRLGFRPRPARSPERR